MALCDVCGTEFPSGIHEGHAWYAEAPVDPRCPNCGSTGHVPEEFEQIRIVEVISATTAAVSNMPAEMLGELEAILVRNEESPEAAAEELEEKAPDLASIFRPLIEGGGIALVAWLGFLLQPIRLLVEAKK